MAGRWWERWLAATMVLGAALWLAAGVLIVWQPAGLSVGAVYSTLVPTAVVTLLVGFAGLEAWLGGRVRPLPRMVSWGAGLGQGLLAMSSRRHQAISASEGQTDRSTLSGRRVGLLAMRAGGIGVVVATLLLHGQAGGFRSLLFSGWFLFFGGALAFGGAVMASEVAPRWAGGLVLGGSLLVFSALTTFAGGNIRRPEMVGPLLPSVGGVPVLSLLLWLLFGAGCAWLGAALWSATRRPPDPSGG